jgi:hypothetical protein
MTLPFIMSKDAITVMVNGAVHTVREGQINFATLRDAIRAKDWDAVPDLISPARAVEKFATGRVSVQNGEVLLDGEAVHNAITSRILDMVSEGFDADPLMKFLERLSNNPSKTAVDELYQWLEGTRLPITEDGCFMAYKKVRSDYMDFYTGKVLNKPAVLMTDADAEYIKTPQGNVTVSVEDGITTLSMPRNKVDDDRDRTCSYGLHFCSLSYLPCYHGGQGRVLLVKIDPADVVSIPSDYDNAKGRAMRYQIMSEHAQDEKTEAYSTPVATATGEARVSARKTEPLTELNTWVLGVNFGTLDRAAQVKALMDACVNQAGEVRSVAQARVDGFDDAWYNLAPNLHRYTGSHIREAVAYAQAYFEGYDRCRGNAPQVQATISEPVTAADTYAPTTPAQRDEILRILRAPITGDETLHGTYDGDADGYWDGVNDRDHGERFDLSPALRGGRSYRKAYIAAYTNKFNGRVCD